MRRLFFALLAALLLSPGAARAEPVSAAFATWLVSAVGISTALATVIANFVVGVALSLAGQLLREKPKVNSSGIQTESTTKGDVTPAKFVLGRYGLEGHLAAPPNAHGTLNAWMTYVLEVSNIPVTGLTGRVAIEGEWHDIDTDPGNADPDYGMPILGLEAAGLPFGWIRFHDGTQTEADAMLVAKYGDHPDRPWTADHILKGTAYAVLTFRFHQEVYSGYPTVRFEVDGIPLYDPRKDSSVGGAGTHRWADPATWEFTRNPQVMVYNILRGITLPSGEVWGGRVPAEDLPLDAWFAAMNECDTLIGSRVQYQAGFEVDVSLEPFDVIRELNKASFTQLSQMGGVFRPRTGPVGTPVLSITDDDLLVTEPKELNPFPGLDATHNAVTGTFVDPGAVYQGRECDPVLDAEWEAEDGGRRLTLDIGLPAVTDKSQAQHLLESFIKDDRRFRVHRLALPPMAAILEPLDAIEWTSDHNGYTGKVFEVVEVEDRMDTMVQVVTIRERDAGDVAWTPEQDVPAPPTWDPLSAPEALVPTLSAVAVAVPDGAGDPRRPGVALIWPASEAPEVDLLRYELRVAATQAGLGGAVVDARDGGATHTAGLVADETYEFRAEYIQPGFPTAWSGWVSVTTGDIRLGESDLADAIRTKIDNAKADAEDALARHDVALDAATGVIAELRERIDLTIAPLPDLPDIPDIPLVELMEVAFGPIPAIPDIPEFTSLDTRLVTQAGEIEAQTRRIETESGAALAREQGLDALAQQVISLSLQLGELRGRVTDAGVYVDPATGKAGIEASGLTGAAQLVVDGLAGEISQRATYADVNEAVLQAAIDPSQLVELEDVFARLSTVEVTASAQDGLISILTDTLTVEGGLITMATVTQDITSLEASLATKVAQTEVDDLTDRVTTAEQELAGFDGAVFSTVLRDVATLRADQEQAIQASLQQFLTTRDGLQAVRQSVAVARQDFWARAEETDAAVAGLRVDLVAQVASAEALIQQEAVARASADAAQASQSAQIELRLDDAETGLAAQAGALDLVEAEAAQTADGLAATVARAEVSTAAVGELERQLGEVALRALLDDHADRAAVASGLSQVRRDTLAQVEEGREALAETREELTAALDAADTRITETRQALATETASRAAAVLALEAALDAVDDARAALAATLQQDYYTATETDGEIATAIAAANLSLQSSIDALEAAQTALSADLAANYYTSAQTDGEISTAVSAAQTVLQSSIDAVEADADANAAGLSSLDTRVTSAEGTISSQGTALTALEATVDDPVTGVDANAAAAAALDTRVTSAEGTISSQASAISTLQSDVAGNSSSISTLGATKVDGAGAVAAIDNVVDANFGDLSTFAGFAQWAIANEDGTNAGFRLDLGGDDVISAVRVLPNGSEDPQTTVKLAADHIILSGDTSVLGSFYTDVLQAEQAWIVSAMIASLSADKITTGTLAAERINIDGVTLTAGPGGELLVNDEGIGRDQLAPGSASDFLRDSRAGEFLPVQLVTWEPLLTLSLGECGLNDLWTVNGFGSVRIVGAHPDQAAGQLRLMRRTKVTGEAWSNWTLIGSTISSGQSPGTWVHDNSFDIFGGVFEDVEYRLEGITTGGLIYGNTHRDCSLTAERRVR